MDLISGKQSGKIYPLYANKVLFRIEEFHYNVHLQFNAKHFTVVFNTDTDTDQSFEFSQNDLDSSYSSDRGYQSCNSRHLK